MRTPIDGARITSRFGLRRHPIYNYDRPHNGVDFAAPLDTPIIAAGKGTVIYASFSGSCSRCGYGNVVKIDHGDGLVTHYAHLNGFAPGITPGATVTQGQMIGYLGSTGSSTGPHLHFEINVDGKYVDPLTFENTNATADALTGDELRMYLSARKDTMAKIAQSREGAKTAAAAPPKAKSAR
jgi:murein DD-endopeptidase MepM/ murein hydrolase activator NlpD